MPDQAEPIPAAVLPNQACSAMIWCDPCRHEFLLAYACKTRYFCPSCHQRRVLLYGEWVE